MGVDYVCYGQINVDVMDEARDIISSLVNQTSFSLNKHGDIVHHGGTDGAQGLYQEFKDLIETLYEEVKMAGYEPDNFEFTMFGKIIIDFTDYYEANEVMVLAVNEEREITVFPDNT